MSCLRSISITAKSQPKESDARKLKRRLPHERAIDDLKAAFSYLSERCDVDADNIGSIGWSLRGCFNWL